jgi:hypothetical protein
MIEAKRDRETETTRRATDQSPPAVFDELLGELDELPGDRSPEAALAAIAEEIATYRNQLPQLLREQAGRFVLIKGADILGTFPDRSAALREGYSRFGVVVPFLVRQISDPEPVVYLPNVVP